MSLVRIDSKSTHGWQARHQITGTGKYKSAFFSDRKYGGDYKALQVALQALEDMKRRWPDSANPKVYNSRPRTSEQARALNKIRWKKTKSLKTSHGRKQN